MSELLDSVLVAQKRGEARGIPSICSSHPWVLKAAMQSPAPLLVESTCNQVNQFGGYTGLTPVGFVTYLRALAGEVGYPVERLLLGGDHLGPSVWQREPAAIAMQKAGQLVRACVEAGYTKIHLDASMHLGDDDPSHPLDLELSARRAAWLAQVAENACPDAAAASRLRYVIGSEVPPPGGATAHEESVRVTSMEAARGTLEVTHQAFLSLGLGSAWGRVIALVVQPGVEFGDDFVLDYQPAAAVELKHFIETTPFIYEAHSTDYQLEASLRSLVCDHFAILKVGPALTFAFRETVFALAMLEDELIPSDRSSHLAERLEQAMLRQPGYWQGHYHGTPGQQAFARKYSLSDRSRYYWAQPSVQAAIDLLLHNLRDQPLPISLVSQFFPHLVGSVRAGHLANSPDAFLVEGVSSVLRAYLRACAVEPG